MNVAVIGYGFCGKATERILRGVKEISRVQIVDPKYDAKISPDEWDLIDYAFICVPTPLKQNYSVMDHFYNGNEFDMSIVHEAIKIIPDRTKIVIRSTVGPNNLEDNWIHWPEFLRENNWEEDSDDKSIPFIIGADGATQSEMESWFTNRKTIFVSPKTAAVYKLSRNAMLAAKVTMANYIHKVCVEQNIEYSNVSSLLKEHANLGTSHWDVPGPDGEYGFGGSCFPKDTTHFASMLGNQSNIFTHVLRCNERGR